MNRQRRRLEARQEKKRQQGRPLNDFPPVEEYAYVDPNSFDFVRDVVASGTPKEVETALLMLRLITLIRSLPDPNASSVSNRRLARWLGVREGEVERAINEAKKRGFLSPEGRVTKFPLSSDN